MSRNALIALSFVLVAVSLQAAPRRGACDVLTKSDLAAVQGEAFVDTKATEARDGSLALSQCFYRLPTLTQSVSVTVMRPAPDAPRGAVKTWWKTHFEAERDHEEEEQSEALRQHGVGDAAAWSGNANAGALYVLHGNSILRISVGGPVSQKEKIARSKRLALRAIKRL